MASPDGDDVALDFPALAVTPCDPPPGLVEGLGVRPRFVGFSGMDYLCEVADEAALRGLRPDFGLLATVPTRGIIATCRSVEAGFDIASRFFAPAVAVNEDPVCGSSHCAWGRTGPGAGEERSGGPAGVATRRAGASRRPRRARGAGRAGGDGGARRVERGDRVVKRSTGKEIAEETVSIVERGSYEAGGRTIDIAAAVSACLDGTRFFTPEELKRLRRDVAGRPAAGLATAFEVVNETTLAGIARVLADGGGPVAALNFASAKNPGGGFLNGSQAQEESLARSSALHASQLRAWEFYERHRSSPSLLYSDAMILSPDCPIIRDDDGTLLDEPRLVTFITSAAPNAGAAATNRPAEVALIAEALRRRSECVLALAAAQGYTRIVLGAWGCGVFRNDDPSVVADAFAGHLRRGAWASRFERVVFSVLDSDPDGETFGAFRDAFG